jgi:predicted O-methyltransferase YrrM
MNCIFCCVFNQEKYVDMFFLLLESIFIYGNLDDNTNILVYTSTSFMNKIKQSHLFNDEKVKFEINDSYDNIDKACKARLDLFKFESISMYEKILYLDTDILIKDDINKVFDVCKEDILYVLEEGTIDNSYVDYWGNILFGDEINNYNDKTAFTSGILLFNNCEKLKALFRKINEDIIERPYQFSCYDQPYIIYNAFKYNLHNNKILKSLVVNCNYNIHSDKVIHHFPGGPGCYHNKIEKMSVFLNDLKDFTINNNILRAKQYINDNLLPIIHNSNELLEGNIFMLHQTTNYTDVFLNKSKNISNLVLNKNIKNVMEIGFNAGFSTLLMLLTNSNMRINCFDLGEHKYTIPCYEKLKETFGERINIIIGDSTKTLLNVTDMYDLIHIDGGHTTEVAESDIINSYRLSKKGTILIMDDYNFGNLHYLWDNYIIKYNLKNLNINVYNSPHHDIKYVSVIKENTFSIPLINYSVLENKTYSWETSYIKFLDNFKMDAFGEGKYKFVDKQNIIANFGGREHNITFNDDYTEFSSVRKHDLQVITGNLSN